MEPVASIFG